MGINWVTIQISRVSDQNGVSLLSVMLEIHHSGRDPSICFTWKVMFKSFCVTKCCVTAQC